MGVIRSGRRTEAEGEISINRGALTSNRWSEITISVFDAAGSESDPSTTTGIVSGTAIKSGSGKPQPFINTVDLSANDWSWQPELSTVEEFRFSVAGLNAGYTYEITVSSWS